MAADVDIGPLSQGHSYTTVLRYESGPIVRVPISAITCPIGAARIATTTPHGMLDGWRGTVVNVQQPKEINAEDPNNIRSSEYHNATVIDASTVEFNDFNIADLKPYTTDGFLQYNTPADLTGIEIRVRLKTKKGGTLLASNLVADAELNVLVTAIDLVKKTITLTFPVAATQLLAGKTGWYDIEAASADGLTVTPLVSGKFTVEKE